MYSLGIDVGSSSVKVSLLDIETGKCVASASNPSTEAPIKAVRKGWAEQSPDSWWQYVCDGVRQLSAKADLNLVASVGISYQMHGLVCVDESGVPVRDAIIWCDSRAVEIGEEALDGIGYDICRERLLNSPGNFTASKLAWVKRNEPEVFARIWKIMLPGDYIAYKLTGKIQTTGTGLSEGIMWDFPKDEFSPLALDWYGISTELIPEIVPAIGFQAETAGSSLSDSGLKEGIPVSYRAGDQPNNAFSLNVLNPGEIAATAGTSGVVYGVTDKPQADEKFRVNTFLHVTDSPQARRLGVLLCINGTGILNAWAHRNFCPDLSYARMDELAGQAPAGCDGLVILPFGNGAERVLENRTVGAGMAGIDLVRHDRNHILRAVQEGIAYSFRYGVDIMKNMGLKPDVIRAGKANMFLSPVFRQTLSTICNARIELFDTDGSLGAARGAALGAGNYCDPSEAFASLNMIGSTEPAPGDRSALEAAYGTWLEALGC